MEGEVTAKDGNMQSVHWKGSLRASEALSLKHMGAFSSLWESS